VLSAVGLVPRRWSYCLLCRMADNVVVSACFPLSSAIARAYRDICNPTSWYASSAMRPSRFMREDSPILGGFVVPATSV
jgi:hypothetical protein